MCDDRIIFAYEDEDYTDDPSELRVLVTTSGHVALEISSSDGVINTVWVDEEAANRLRVVLKAAFREVRV